MRGLVIDTPWIDLILSGEKTWEMRRRRTTTRGLIALIRKGSGKVEGVACLDDVLDPLARARYERHFPQHRIPKRESKRSFDGRYRVPWVFTDARRLNEPVPYRHPRGAMSWVVLSDEVARRMRLQLRPDMRRHLLAMPKDDREFERLTARPRVIIRRRR